MIKAADRSCGRLLPRTSSEAESTCIAALDIAQPSARPDETAAKPAGRVMARAEHFAERPVVVGIGLPRSSFYQYVAVCRKK